MSRTELYNLCGSPTLAGSLSVSHTHTHATAHGTYGGQEAGWEGRIPPGVKLFVLEMGHSVSGFSSYLKQYNAVRDES